MKYLFITLLLAQCLPLFAQGDAAFIRQGNRSYKAPNYAVAEDNYRKALQENPASSKGEYNLGNAIYEQERYEEAAKHFSTAAVLADDKTNKAKALHNLGNSFLKANKYQESVAAYKEALKNNPKDLETKYNLAFALQKLKEQQKQEQEQEQEKNEDQEEKEGDDNQESQDDQNSQDQKDQEQKEQEKKEQEQKDQEAKDSKEGEQKDQKDADKEEDQEIDQSKAGEQGEPQPQNMSREEVLKLLEVMDNEELKVQEKLRKTSGKRTKIEKDW